MCQGFTKSYGGLLGLRFLMGIVETGLPAGAGLLIASYYRKKELSLRFALFFTFGQLGACFSGVSSVPKTTRPRNMTNNAQLLAYAIVEIDGYAGYSGWRWIFIIEGLMTIFFSIFVFIFVPHFPAKDSWLKDEDRARLLARLDADKGEEHAKMYNVSWTKLLFDKKIWLLTLLFFCADMSAGSISSFNPTILSQLGWKARRANVMTIPIWVVGIVGT